MKAASFLRKRDGGAASSAHSNAGSEEGHGGSICDTTTSDGHPAATGWEKYGLACLYILSLSPSLLWLCFLALFLCPRSLVIFAVSLFFSLCCVSVFLFLAFFFFLCPYRAVSRVFFFLFVCLFCVCQFWIVVLSFLSLNLVFLSLFFSFFIYFLSPLSPIFNFTVSFEAPGLDKTRQDKTN